MSESQFIIEPEQISKDALENIIKDYVMREGTDYGHTSLSLEQKTERVMKQVRSKSIVILYDNDLGSCNLITKQELETQQASE